MASKKSTLAYRLVGLASIACLILAFGGLIHVGHESPQSTPSNVEVTDKPFLERTTRVRWTRPRTTPDPHPPTHRNIKEGTMIKVDDELRAEVETGEEGSSPLHFWTWRGTECIKGGQLTSGKLLSNCRKRSVDEGWCNRIKNANANGESLCGQYVEGSLSSSESVTADALERLRHSIVDGIAAAKTKGPQCNDPGTFGSVIEPSMVYFDAENVLHSRVCTSFSYLKGHGAAAASVLHYHSSVIGKYHDRRGILFSGDSMMRQLFLSLIATIRGDGQPMDHFFHMDALYVMYADRDALIVLDNANKKAPTTAKILREWFPGYLGDADGQDGGYSTGPDAPLLAMLYLWDTKPDTHRHEPFRMGKLSLHIAAFMYWWQKMGISTIDKYLSSMKQHLMQNSLQSYVYVTTPSGKDVNDSARCLRNAKMASWVATLGNRQRWLLDFSGIADANNFRLSTHGTGITKVPDGIHYSCVWLPKYPDLITGMKDNKMGCKDPMNAALSQWLLALLNLIE